jgi:amidase
VVGLRPTPGLVAKLHRRKGTDAALGAQLMAVDGPLARSIADIRLAMRCLTAPDPRDGLHIPGAPAAPPAATPRKVALVRDVGVAAPAPAVDAALDQAAAWLADAGCVVEEVELPLLAEAYRLWWLLAIEEFRLGQSLIDEQGDDEIQEAFRSHYAVAADWHGEQPSLADYINGYARRGTLIEQLSVFMHEHPLVLLPVSAEEVFEQDADLGGADAMRRLVAAQWSMMAIPVLGFPALSVPTGVVGGLPVGVQLLGRRFGEEDVLRAGEAIEARAGRFTPIDPV